MATPGSGLGADQLKAFIREVPDFPKPGILFYDITTLLKMARPFARLVDLLAEPYLNQSIAVVAGIEARGFIFGPALAYRLGAGFVPIRKPHKLPAATASVEYSLEYGHDRVEIHRDAIAPGERVLIVDDLIATGGTAAASAQLVEQLGGTVAGLAFVVELTFLHGRERLAGYAVRSLLQYDR
ncbi:MAG: adenine phosphoribosyltransferase [Terriglobales bacterium]